jgi:tetratricopeptide (TPR) repeat protein
MLAYIYVTQNKYTEAAPILEAQLNSSFASTAEKNTINKQLLGIYFNLKNYAKVIELGQALVTSGVADGSTYNVMAQAYDKLGKLGDAVKFIKARVDASTAKGQKPAENELLLLLDYQGRQKDSAGKADTFEKLVSFYPKPQYWANIMPSLISAPENTDAVTINIYRLMASNGTLKQHTDYSEFAKLAIVEGAAGEAVNLVQKGLATNVFPEDRKASANRLLEAGKKQLLADQAALPKAEADAKAATTGDADIRVGKSYYGMGQADKAIEAYKRGIAKGGLKSVEEAQLLLGIALVSQKKSAEATAAFQAARKGSDSKFANVARYWALNAK